MTTVDGVGPQLQSGGIDNGIRGWLCFEYLPSWLQNAEDSTLAADDARWRETLGRSNFHWPGRSFSRPASVAERTLLEHLGYELPEELATLVEYVASGVRRRTWPQLESETTE
jgi:hypothetical protein